MLIVNTDHGFMLGEKGWMGKNVQPVFEEISHIPFFIYDPRFPECRNQRRNALAQTVDIVPTLADFFRIASPEFMDGKNLLPVIRDDTPVRDNALFGIYGEQVNITDGRYVYMRAPVFPGNGPLYTYTLMPCHMRNMFSLEEMKRAELVKGFPHMKESRVMKIPQQGSARAYDYGNRLYDLKTDPFQQSPIYFEETEKRLTEKMKELMKENEAPEEQYIRLGLQE